MLLLVVITTHGTAVHHTLASPASAMDLLSFLGGGDVQGSTTISTFVADTRSRRPLLVLGPQHLDKVNHELIGALPVTAGTPGCRGPVN